MKGFPRLKNVLLAEGLKANVISISQICDLNLHVNFSNDKCFVMDEFGNYILLGSRSFDNCYTLSQSYIIKSTNVVVDDFKDFVEFLNKAKIYSFANEAVTNSNQLIATKFGEVVTSKSEPDVATSVS